MRISRHRAIVAAVAAAIAFTSTAAITPASARPYYQQHRGGSNAAVLGAVAGVFGIIAGLAARDRYDRRYGYDGYGAYAPPAPYGYYGPRSYYR